MNARIKRIGKLAEKIGAAEDVLPPCKRCGKQGCLGDGRDVRIDPDTGDSTIYYCQID